MAGSSGEFDYLSESGDRATLPAIGYCLRVRGRSAKPWRCSSMAWRAGPGRRSALHRIAITGCADNGAMIAFAASLKHPRGGDALLEAFPIHPRWDLA